MLQLNRENYHSPEANQDYMSRSQYEDFLCCEAAALAKVKGEYREEPTDAMLAGSYLHAWSEGTQTEFIAEHEEMFTKQGKLKSQFVKVEEMIEAVKRQPMCMTALNGQKEVILTAEMFGAMWRIMLDVYHQEEGIFVEIKSTKSINELVWSEADRCKSSFIEVYGYMTQAAIYAEVERLATGRDGYIEPIMLAVSKEDPPDVALINLHDEDRFAYELDTVKANLPRILAVKAGTETAKRCEVCAYCRKTKQVGKILHYSAIGG